MTEASPAAGDLPWRRRYREILLDALADGPEGVLVLAVNEDRLDAPGEDLVLACGLAPHLAARGYGVVVRARSRWRDLPRRTAAVVALTPDVDPGEVPDRVPAIAWVLDQVPAWLGHQRLSSWDLVAAGSEVLAVEMRRRTAAPVDVLPPAIDVERSGGSTAPDADGVGEPRAAEDVSPPQVVAVLDAEEAFAVAKAMPVIGRVARLTVHAPAVTDLVRPWWPGPPDRDRLLADLAASDLAVLGGPGRARAGYGLPGRLVLEAAAAGAVPVLPSELGVADLGLPMRGAYRNRRELEERVASHLADLVGLRRSADAVQRLVRTEHSAARRADQLLELVERARQIGPPRLSLGYLPDLRVTNPYQDMLYADLARAGVRTTPLSHLDVQTHARGGEDLRRHVLHVHWTSALVQDAPTVVDARRLLDRFRERVRDHRARGGRLVWTVHNVVPHETRYRSLEIELCQLLADEADVVHVMGQSTLPAIGRLYHIDPDKLLVVPHSSYEGVYPRFVTSADARARLGLAAHDTVLLALGGIRPYRGLDLLVDVFEVLLRRDPRLRLLVAGKPGRFPGAAELRARCERHPRIVARFAHVPDAELQVWNAAADLAVLPYRAILNSGAFKLAETAGLPVVAPRDGALAALVDQEHTFGFRPGDAADLERAVRAAVDLVDDPDALRRAHLSARAAATAYTPQDMARDFADGLLRRLAR